MYIYIYIYVCVYIYILYTYTHPSLCTLWGTSDSLVCPILRSGVRRQGLLRGGSGCLLSG